MMELEGQGGEKHGTGTERHQAKSSMSWAFGKGLVFLQP